MLADLYTTVHRDHIAYLRSLPVIVDEQGMRLGGTYVMFNAEAELMAKHAEALLDGRDGADVLEIGLGLGVFAAQTAPHCLASYTAIEIHPAVAAHTEPSLGVLGVPAAVHVAPWQTVDLPRGSFDAIMYDTWPPDGLADADFARFVEHVALPCLRLGGRFSFFYPGWRLSAARARVLDAAFPGWTAAPYRLPADRIPRQWTFPTCDFTVPIATKEAP